MNKPADIFILVANGKPTVYENFSDAVKMYLHNIDICPNAYEYQGAANEEKLHAQINKAGKLTFYAFTNLSAPTAIALYKSALPYNENDWYNMAAKENLKNNAAIESIEAGLHASNERNASNKELAKGDFVELSDGRCGRVTVIHDDTMQVCFNTPHAQSFPISNNGTVLNASGLMGELFAKPAGFSLKQGKPKMGAYWMLGAGWVGQGNKRLDIYAKTNVWLIYALDAVA